MALSNAKDKAAAAAAAGAREKEKLNGSQLVAEQHKNEVADAAKVEIPPYDKEIYVIQMIKKKVLSFASTCGECVSHSLPSSMPCVTQCHSALCSTGSDGLTFGG